MNRARIAVTFVFALNGFARVDPPPADRADDGSTEAPPFPVRVNLSPQGALVRG
jgi:hypothetical protein